MRTFITIFLALPLSISLITGCAFRQSQSNSAASSLETGMSKEAGRGGLLLISQRLGNGKKLPFIVDTGCPFTLLDKSLEPHLGKRLGTNSVWLWGKQLEAGVYAAPQLKFQNRPLRSGPIVVTCDLKKTIGWNALGILGMDCLRHYCLQLDFNSRVMRFLDTNQTVAAMPGKMFPLTLSNFGHERKSKALRPYILTDTPVGGAVTNVMIDTGLNLDWGLESGLLNNYLADLSTNRAKQLGAETWRLAEVCWQGETFTDIKVCKAEQAVAGERANVLGLRFLARFLVVLDFPQEKMYLQKENLGVQ